MKISNNLLERITDSDVGYAQLEGGDDVEDLAHREGGVKPIGLEDRADAS